MSDLFLILVTVGSIARITRLITADHMRPFVWLRRQIKRIPVLGEMIITRDDGTLVGCDWCVSVWVAAWVVPLAYYQGDQPWFLIPAAVLAASHVTGWLASAEPE